MKSRFGFLVVFALTFLLVLKGIDDYAPLTEGWWHVYVRWVGAGKVPYRDFEYLLPPGYIYILRMATQVFGEHFLQLRILGAIQLGILGVSIFSILRRITPQFMAGLIALASIEYLTLGTAFWSYDYVYTALTLMFVAVALALKYEYSHWSAIVLWRQWTIVGFFVGLAMTIKQSHGLWTLIVITVILISNNFRSRAELKHKALLVSGGVLTVWIPILVWFWLRQVSPIDLWSQIFVSNGPKGPTSQIFLGWLRNISNLYGEPGIRNALASQIGLLQSIAPFILTSFVIRELGADLDGAPVSKQVGVMLAALSVITLWFFDWQELGIVGQTLSFFAEEFRINATIGTWQASLILAAIMFFQREQTVNGGQLVSIVAIATSVMWACGMSGGISEIGAFFALGTSLSLTLRITRNHWISVLIVSLISLAVLSTSWHQKTELPYSWWGYTTPSAGAATGRFSEGLMTGLQSSPEIIEGYQEIQDILRQTRSCPGEIVAYPHLPVVLIDASVLPLGRLGQYWYDFTTQESISVETRRLQATKVKAVVFLELPESALIGHENLFYAGQSIAHRQLLGYLLQLTESMNREVNVTLSPETKLSLWVDECAGSRA